MRQRRNEAVLFAEQLHVLDEIPPVSPVCRAEVVNPKPRHTTDDQVRDPRGPPPDRAFLPCAAPTTDEVEAAFERVEKVRKVFRKVLQVGIHRDDDRAVRGGQTGLEGRGLAEVPPQLDYAEPGLGKHQPPGAAQAVVGASVVDEHELEPVSMVEPVGGRAEPFHELGQGCRLVEHRRHDADERALRRRCLRRPGWSWVRCHHAVVMGRRPTTAQL